MNKSSSEFLVSSAFFPFSFGDSLFSITELKSYLQEKKKKLKIGSVWMEAAVECDRSLGSVVSSSSLSHTKAETAFISSLSGEFLQVRRFNVSCFFIYLF